MDWVELIHASIAARRPVALATVLAVAERPDLAGRHLVLGADGLMHSELPGDPWEPALAEAARLALQKGEPISRKGIYAEPYLPPPVLLVAGAGHVAQPVAEIGRLAGFAVTIIDDRAEYANPARFPTADQIICDDFATALRKLDPGPNHYAVLLTRGHRHDLACLRELLHRPLPYIGMIGSRSRVQTVLGLLKTEQDLTPNALERLHAPIGLDIGARSPGAIAVAVIAEILKVRSGGSGEHLSRLDRVRIHGR